MKKIVAAVDFSPVSQNAAEYAGDMAFAMGAELTLLHVYQLPYSYSEIPTPVKSLEELRLEAGRKLAQLRSQIMDRIKGMSDVEVELREGGVVAQIDNYCDKVHPYAVVMGAEAAGSIERLLFGGKTISAIKQLSWPLIVVPPGVRFENIRRIGLACDLREVLETVPFMEIKRIVKEFDAELHLLHAIPDSADVFADDLIKESGWLRDMLNEVDPHYHFMKDNDVEKAITEFADQNGIDLLIVIPKRHNLFTKIFAHSHSKRIVLHTHVPVMTIHE